MRANQREGRRKATPTDNGEEKVFGLAHVLLNITEAILPILQPTANTAANHQRALPRFCSVA